MTLDDWLESATGQQVVEVTRAEARRHEFLPVLSKCSCGWWATPEQGARGAISEWENHADKAALRAALGVRVEVPCAECGGTGELTEGDGDHEGAGCHQIDCPACFGRGVVSGEPALIVGGQLEPAISFDQQSLDAGSHYWAIAHANPKQETPDGRPMEILFRLIPLEEETREDSP